MNEELQRRIEFLREAKIGELKHSEKGLLAHLLGTRKLLEQWGARAALCAAGLFHSVYGTDAYPLNQIVSDSLTSGFGPYF